MPQSYMSRTCLTLERLRDREVNYFGTFRSGVYMKELTLLEEALRALLEVRPCYHLLHVLK
jgi:hypothetical protein